MKFKMLIFFIILPILLFLGCNSKETVSQKEEIMQKEEKIKIFSYKLKTLDNKEINIEINDSKVKIKEYPNKVVLLSFFASWCPPCLAEIPNLVSLQKKYKKDFVIISMLLEKGKTDEELLKFKKEHNINFLLVNSEENFKLADNLGPVRSIPAMFMIDKNQEVFQKYVGLVPLPMMELDIKKVINNK